MRVDPRSPLEAETVKPKLAPEVQESLEGRWEPLYRSQLHYLIAWSTRGRRAVLRDGQIQALQDLLRRTAEERGITLVESSIASDHVHLLIALQPTYSVASAIRELKGRTGISMLAQFPELRVRLRGNLLWDERYTVETVSAARVDRVRARLRALHGPDEELAVAS
jgi:putative transposase